MSDDEILGESGLLEESGLIENLQDESRYGEAVKPESGRSLASDKTFGAKASSKEEGQAASAVLQRLLARAEQGDVFIAEKIETVFTRGSGDQKPLPLNEDPPQEFGRDIEDLTVPLTHVPAHSESASDLVDMWCAVLEQHKILILTCFDIELLFHAGYCVTESFQGEKRFLAFKDDDSKGQGASVDALLACKDLWNPPTLVLVEAAGLNDQSFIDSIVKTAGRLLGIQNRLDQCGVRLLILTTYSHLAVSGDKTIPHFPVPFVEPRLRERFQAQAADWANEIQLQRKVGLWGKDEKDFWERFDGFLKRGNIDREIEEMRRVRSDPEKIRVYLSQPDAKPLLALGAELENTALFLAAFFPNLSVEDFQDLLVRLLGDSSRSMKQVNLIPTRPTGEPEIREEIEVRRTFVDEWHENYIEICQRCHLQFWRDTTEIEKHASSVRGVVVQFDTPDLRGRVCEEFLRTHYLTLTRLFVKVMDERFLFHSSPAVLEGMLQLLQKMASANPQSYGSKMLLALKADPTESTAPEQQMNDSVPKSIDTKLLMGRLYHVVRTLMRKPALQEVVHQFLTDLINQGRHEDLLDLVRRLRFAMGFDQVYWWKQLLDRGQARAKERTYQEMLAILQTGGSQLLEVLLEIKKWLPDPGQEARSESAIRANCLLVELLEISILRRARTWRQPVWPPEDALQQALCGADLSTGDRSILSWLFHSSLTQMLQKDEWIIRHVHGLVDKWVVNNPVKKYLQPDAEKLVSRWYHHFRQLHLPGKALSFATPLPEPLIFQALILADLAVTLGGVVVATGDGSAEVPLQRVAAAVVRICRPEQRLLLERYWSECLNLLAEVKGKIQPPHGIEDENFRLTRARLEAQFKGVAELRDLVAQFADFNEVEGV